MGVHFWKGDESKGRVQKGEFDLPGFVFRELQNVVKVGFTEVWERGHHTK